jgi:hypothetical protein
MAQHLNKYIKILAYSSDEYDGIILRVLTDDNNIKMKEQDIWLNYSKATMRVKGSFKSKTRKQARADFRNYVFNNLTRVFTPAEIHGTMIELPLEGIEIDDLIINIGLPHWYIKSQKEGK